MKFKIIVFTNKHFFLELHSRLLLLLISNDVWKWTIPRPFEDLKHMHVALSTTVWRHGLKAALWSTKKIKKWKNISGTTNPTPCIHVSFSSRKTNTSRSQVMKTITWRIGLGASDSCLPFLALQQEDHLPRRGRKCPPSPAVCAHGGSLSQVCYFYIFNSFSPDGDGDRRVSSTRSPVTPPRADCSTFPELN